MHFAAIIIDINIFSINKYCKIVKLVASNVIKAMKISYFIDTNDSKFWKALCIQRWYFCRADKTVSLTELPLPWSCKWDANLYWIQNHLLSMWDMDKNDINNYLQFDIIHRKYLRVIFMYDWSTYWLWDETDSIQFCICNHHKIPK